MRKRRIQLSTKWLKIFPTLTRNQILLCVCGLGKTSEVISPEEINVFISKLYFHNNKKIKEDKEIIDKIYTEEGIFIFHESNSELAYDNYFQIKVETFKNMLNAGHSKQELLVLFWLLNLYVIKQTRSYELKIKNVLIDIFGKHTNIRQFKDDLINGLNKFKEYEYKNGDCLVKSFEIKGKMLMLVLDEKKRKRTKYYYKNRK